MENELPTTRGLERREIENKAKFVVLGIFGEDDLVGNITNVSRKTNKRLEESIDLRWQGIVTNDPNIFAGSMFGVSNWNLKDNKLYLELFETDFREYVGTRRLEDLREYGYQYLANPVGVSTVMITSDGKLIGAKRLSGDKSEHFDVPGGAVSPQEDVVKGKVDFFHAAKRELAEELSFDSISVLEKYIGRMVCLGLIYEYAGLCHPQLIFVAETSSTGAEIKGRASGEIEPLVIEIGRKNPTLRQVFKSFYPKIEPDGRVAAAMANNFNAGKRWQSRILRNPSEL